MTQNTHDFGYKAVSADQKTSLVSQVFSSVASRYDIMNDLMSAGLHRLWKRQFVNRLPMPPQARILDCAAGTGDITALMLRRQPTAHVTMVDPNAEMLAQGRHNLVDRGLVKGYEIICAPGEALPIPDASQDLYTISFGLRNVTDRAQALAEAYRTLRPGGWFYCLEFSHVHNPLLAKAYDLYSFAVIPTVGAAVAGTRDAYQYLVESIRRFPNQATLSAELSAAGFSQVSYDNILQGVVAIHWGLRAD